MSESWTPARIVDVLLRPRLGAEADRWRVEGPVAGGNEAWLFRATAPGGGPRWAIKAHRSIAPKALERRYAAHVATAHWLSDTPEFTVPEPIGLVVEHAVTLMQWVPEPPLLQLLSDRRAVGEGRLAAIERVGRWLRRFHDRDREPGAVFSATRELERIERLLARRLLKGRRAHLDRSFQDHLDRLRRRAGSLDGIAVPAAVLHDDFNAKNILQGERRTVGIDFIGLERGSVVVDLCRFLVRLDGNALWLPGRGPLGPLGVPAGEQAALLRGYLVPGEVLDARVLAWMQLAMVLRRWSTLAGTRVWRLEALYDRAAVARLRRAATAIVTAMEADGRGPPA